MLSFSRVNIPAFADSTSNVHVYLNPYSNCQLFCIANAQHILRQEDPLAEFINISTNVCNKNQMIIDVLDITPFTRKVNKIFKGYINKRTRYINTTGSPMIQYFIKIRQLIRDKQQPVQTQATS